MTGIIQSVSSRFDVLPLARPLLLLDLMQPHTRVLVADDDPDLLGAVAAALEQRGAEVVRATSGSELVQQMVDGGPFALIVTDVSMPWMDGLEVMHTARNAGFGAPVILITASRDEAIAERVRALGDDALLLRKPFRLSSLVEAADRLVEGSILP